MHTWNLLPENQYSGNLTLTGYVWFNRFLDTLRHCQQISGLFHWHHYYVLFWNDLTFFLNVNSTTNGFFLVIQFWVFFSIFLLYPSKIQERLLYSFSYTRPFSKGLVIHFCYTWIFIEIFVILRFVIQLSKHNQKKAIWTKSNKNVFYKQKLH